MIRDTGLWDNARVLFAVDLGRATDRDLLIYARHGSTPWMVDLARAEIERRRRLS